MGLASGTLGGFFGGLLGLGGGVIMIPLMTWLAKVTQHQAHGTSLVAIVFTGIVGAVTYYGLGGVDLKIALILAVSATITARFGALYAHSLPEKKLKVAFGCFLIFASILLVVKGYLPITTWTPGQWIYMVIFLAIGSVTGFVSGMMGVGGGGIMVPLMVVVGNVGQHMAQG
ncbi:MAG: sulfite exporter TauE/SafE family protein, partial [Syntrophorhabdus sp.]|nr:sulfite exporter TauE/SafE family protein [Syntrophorhabdus sp.]